MKKISRREAIKKGGQLVIGAAAGTSLNIVFSGCSNQEPSRSVIADVMKNAEKADIENIKLTVIYDNMYYKKGLPRDWGFSCLVQGIDKTILFDTGGNDRIFMSNMSKLKINPHQIDELVISHDHWDHTGGAIPFLKTRSNIKVALVKSFRSDFKRTVKKYGSCITEIDQPKMITKNCITTGEMKNFVKNEHSLVILTNKGSIIITGCAHPGVVEIVERVKKITSDEVLLVMGGFHLLNNVNQKIQKIVQQLKELGVSYIAPSHCSGGEKQYEIFSELYGSKLINSGIGRIITANDLVG